MMHNVTDGNPFHTLGLPDSLGSFEQVFRARLWRDINEVRQKIAKTNGKTPQWLLDAAKILASSRDTSLATVLEYAIDGEWEEAKGKMLASLRATVPEIFNLRPSFPLPVEADLFFRESLKFPNAEFREQIGVWLIKEFGLPDEESEPLIEEYLVLYSQNFLEAMGAIPQLGYIEMVPNSFMLDELLTITGRIENMLPLPRSGPDKRYWPMREFLKMVAQNWDDWFSSAGRPEAKGGAPSIKPLHRHDFPSRS